MISSLVESLIVLLALILAALWLKKRKVLRDTDSKMLSAVITDLLLPALIFSGLSQNTLTISRLEPAIVMLMTTLILLVLSWQIGKFIGLERARLGSFILISAIGSSSTLGYSLIQEMFPNNTNALFDAIIAGEIGVIVPLFLVAVPIAIHFGQSSIQNQQVPEDRFRELKQFLRSPIFIALVSGIIASFIPLPEGVLMKAFFRTLKVLGDALPVFVALGIGILLRPTSVKSIFLPIFLVLVIKLFLEPFLVFAIGKFFTLQQLEQNVLAIEAAMPSGTLSAILASRYGCDGQFASAAVVVTYIVSLASVPLVALLAS